MGHFEAVRPGDTPGSRVALCRESVDSLNETAYAAGAAVAGFGLFFVDNEQQQTQLVTKAESLGMVLVAVDHEVEQMKNVNLLKTHIQKTTTEGPYWSFPRVAR